MRFPIRRRSVGENTRLRALRELYREFFRVSDPESRGRRLLREWLSTEQRVQYDQSGYFEVIGCHTGRRYRIHYGASSNLHEVSPTGQPSAGWCFVPDGTLVPGDIMLAQKIALETNELGALAVANKFTPRAPPPVPRNAARRSR